MKAKRILSVLLAVCILASLMPAVTLPARAANADPDYQREVTPELVVLNAISGKNEAFLDSVKEDAKYNAVAAKKFVNEFDDKDVLTYKQEFSGNFIKFYTWEDFRNTNLALLHDKYGQLQTGLAVTLTNDPHDHRIDWKTVAHVISYADVDYGCFSIDSYMYHAHGYSKSQKTFRKGVGSYHDMRSNMHRDEENEISGRSLALTYSTPEIGYDNYNKGCKCGGKASKTVVSFYDGEAPEITSVQVLAESGKSYYFGKGDVVNITVTCSEPIRFSDDSAKDKGDIYIGMKTDGNATPLYARLTSLKGNVLTFQYQCPTEEEVQYHITDLDLTAAPSGGKSLVTSDPKKTEIPLVYIYGNNETVTAKTPSGADNDVGYSKSTSYVTDLAGNALKLTKKDDVPKLDEKGEFIKKPNGSVETVEIEVSAVPKVYFYIDTEAPKIVKAAIVAKTNNADVKDDLGKKVTDPLPDNYEDNSDRYLGVGDSFYLELYFNEYVLWTRGPKVTLNIRSKASDYYQATEFIQKIENVSANVLGDQYGLGTSGGQITKMTTGEITVSEPMYIPEDGIIELESIDYQGDNIWDFCDNYAYNPKTPPTPSQKYHLDTDPADATLERAVQTGGVNQSFYVPFTVSDTGNSGVAGLKGKLKLNGPDETPGTFMYLVSDKTAPASDAVWTKGAMGSELPFTVTSAKQYLHIRPVEGETYNFGDNSPATLTFTLRDYAGTGVTTEAKPISGASMDSLPPTATAGGTRRVYDNANNRGTLKVDVLPEDPSGISDAKFQWTDEDATEADLSQNWTACETENGTRYAYITVDNNTIMRKNLWVKVTDNVGYSAVVNLGAFTYDLKTRIDYEIKYSGDILARTGIELVSFDTSKGMLVFDATIDGSNTHYCIYVGPDTIGRLNQSNLLDRPGKWYKATVSDTDGYHITLGDEDSFFLSDAYAGNVHVTVYSGNNETILRNNKEITINTNAKQETFTLRQSPNYPYIQYSDGAFSGAKRFYVDDETWAKLSVDPVDSWYVDDGNDVRFASTLEGVQVQIDLGGDAYGWDYRDINWDDSFIALVSSDTYYYNWTGEVYAFVKNYISEHPESRLCGIGRGPTQTITLPASELYTTGTKKDLYLMLARYSGDTPYIIRLYRDSFGDPITLDAAAPGELELTTLGGYIDSEDRFQTIGLNPDGVNYIPTEGQEVKLTVEQLAEDGSAVKPTNCGGRFNYLGWFDVLAWNVTTDPDGENKIRLNRSYYDEDAGMFGHNNSMSAGDISRRSLGFGPENDETWGVLGVEPDRDNLIALQSVFDNGKTSGVKYVTVHPVSIATPGKITTSPEQAGEDGFVTVDRGAASVVFTPEAGANTAGLTFYCAPGYVWNDSNGNTRYELLIDSWYGEEMFDSSKEMTLEGGAYVWHVPDADADAYQKASELYWQDSDNNPYPGEYPGVYVPPMGDDPGYYNFLNSISMYSASSDSDPIGFYVVYATDSHDNFRYVGITDNAIIADGTAPILSGYQAGGGGMVVNAAEGPWPDEPEEAPETDAITLEGELDEEEEIPFEYDNRPVIHTFEDGTYEAIFRIRDDSLLSYDEDVLPRPMTLKWNYDAAYGEAIGQPGGSLTLTNVVDGFEWNEPTGNSMGIFHVDAELVRSGALEGSWHEVTTYYGCATDACLVVTVYGQVSPKITDPMDMTLYLTATDAHGNQSEPVGVTASVKGVKPQMVSAEYRQASVGGTDRALFLTFSTPVKPVESWINRNIDRYDTVWYDAFPIWKDGTWDLNYTDAFGAAYVEPVTLENVFGEYGIDLGFSTLDYVSKDTGVTIVAEADSDGEIVEGSVTTKENGTFTVTRTAGNDVDYLAIHLNNIVSGAPEETIFFYFEQYGDMYVAGEDRQPRGETNGPVVVSYQTDRPTSPDGDTTATLRYGESDVFTLKYRDEPTKTTYTITGKLSDYGITLGPTPPEYADEDAPSIDVVTIWRQKGGGYVQTEAFPGNADEAAVKNAISNAGPAQSYNFVVNASDYSRWKVVVKSAVPSTMSYADARSDNIDGVEVSGNNVLVKKKAVSSDFYIVVVDNAKADSAATKDNFSYIKIPNGSYQFDTTPPEIVTKTLYDDLYSRTVLVKASDKDDSGNPAGEVTVSGAGLIAQENTVDGVTYTHKLFFVDNDASVAVTATDAAGNMAVTNVKVSGIDVTAPKLTVTWSPCFQDETTGKLDQNNPTAVPVNTNVIAHVNSDKKILSVTANDGSDLTFVDGVAEAAWGKVEYDADRITVRFTSKEATTVRLAVTAPNGKTTTLPVTLSAGTVDKDAPVVNDTPEPRIRTGYTVPYAERHILLFDEDVYCMDGGEGGTRYNGVTPFEVTLADEEAQTFRFVDRAGNITEHTVSPSMGTIDCWAPDITLEYDDEAAATNTSVPITVISDEAVTLTSVDASVACGALHENADGTWTGTIQASENGTFRVTAADAAGNKADAVFTINNIDRVLPIISFAASTVKVRQDASVQDLKDRLDLGVTAWDDVELAAGSLKYDFSEVDLATPGVYTVPYTVKDIAGNETEVIRYVKVTDKRILGISIDGEWIDAEGVSAISIGSHSFTVSGLIGPGEPYSLKIVRGIYSAGQMKRVSVDVPIGADGTFTLEDEGFYTLYILTQSRQTYRTLLHAEN